MKPNKEKYEARNPRAEAQKAAIVKLKSAASIAQLRDAILELWGDA